MMGGVSYEQLMQGANSAAAVPGAKAWGVPIGPFASAQGNYSGSNVNAYVNAARSRM